MNRQSENGRRSSSSPHIGVINKYTADGSARTRAIVVRLSHPLANSLGAFISLFIRAPTLRWGFDNHCDAEWLVQLDECTAESSKRTTLAARSVQRESREPWNQPSWFSWATRLSPPRYEDLLSDGGGSRINLPAPSTPPSRVLRQKTHNNYKPRTYPVLMHTLEDGNQDELTGSPIQRERHGKSA